MEIDLRHLRLLRAVADEGSITRAAAVLGASQPAVTRQLGRLERAMGGELFARTREGVAPTALGRSVVNRARSVLPVVDSLQADTETASASHWPTHARVAARTGSGLVPLLHALQTVLPHSEVTAESETRTDALLELVSAGQLDVAMVHEYVGHDLPLPDELERFVVTEHPVLAMVSEDHPLASRSSVHLEELADDDWVLPPLDADDEQSAVLSACQDAGFVPRVSHYLTGGPCNAMVRCGEAVGSCHALAQFSGISTIPLEGNPITYRVLLLLHRRGALRQYAESLASLVRNTLRADARQLPAWPAVSHSG